jgi:hypothetical protein
MGPLHGLLYLGIHAVAGLAASLHRAVGGLLELLDGAANAVLPGLRLLARLACLLLLGAAASLLGLACLLVQVVHALLQILWRGTRLQGALCLVGAFLDAIDSLLDLIHLHGDLLVFDGAKCTVRTAG